MLREGMGSEEQDLGPVVPDFAGVVAPHEDFASIEVLPDLKASGSALTMAEDLHDQSLGLPTTRGCEVASSQSSVSFVHSGDNCSEIVVADLTANHVTDPRVAVEIQDWSVDHLTSPYPLVSVPSLSRCDVFADRGCGVAERVEVADGRISSPCLEGLDLTAMTVFDSEVAVVADVVGNTDCPLNFPSQVCSPLLSRSQEHSCSVYTVEQGFGMVGDGVQQSVAGELDVGGEGGRLGYAVAVPDSATAVDMPVSRGPQLAVCSSLPSVPLMGGDDCCGSDDVVSEEVEGMVREEGRAPPAAKEALRPQPADGLRQLPRHPVGPPPVSVVEAVVGGGLMPGDGGSQSSRSFAHVVRPDRRADVELSFCPPADGVLFRGSPSPRPPRVRRGPPSPGTRPRRLRSPSPVISSSTDPEEFSSAEDEDASEAAVTASEVEDMSDLEDVGLILTHAPELSPIHEEDGKIGASGSSISGSPVLSPMAAEVGDGLALSDLVLDAQGGVCLVAESGVAADFEDEPGGSVRVDDAQFAGVADAMGVG
ncbi:hypothetical protein Dimus_030428 [Dionaea muscipula]